VNKDERKRRKKAKKKDKASISKNNSLKYSQIKKKSNPGNAMEDFQQGVACHQQGRTDEAMVYYKKAIKKKPDNAFAYCNMGMIMRSQGKIEEAISSYKKAIFSYPNYVEAHYNLGNALKEQGKLNEAVASYQKAIYVKPEYALAHYNLGLVLEEQDELNKAFASYQKAISIKPDYAEAHNNLGNVLKAQGKIDEALVSYQKALSIDSNYAKALSNIGIALQEQGKLDEALVSYQKALSINPDYAIVHFNLSTTKKYTSLSEIQDMKNHLANATEIEDKMNFSFAIGKALADLKQDQEAFQYFIEGNRLKRKTIDYSIADETKRFKKFHTIFNKPFFESRKDLGCKDITPIFILGMPRSGSTLIEQILSSHPDCYGAGELQFIQKIIVENMSTNLSSETVSRLNSDTLIKMGMDYISKIRDIEPNAKYIIDKAPPNFLFLGIIKLMLPNAKIIHSVRSPEDTCLSIFRTKFTGVYNYAYNLTELGQYYRLYSELMYHWHSIFPGIIYDIHYEKLTINQEKETQKLLEFCGLNWDEKCLSFHKTVRAVKTASNYQVRQPMYRTSVGAWKRFEKQLQPLVNALRNLSSMSG